MPEGTTLIFVGISIAIFGVVALPIVLHDSDTGASLIDQLFDVAIINGTQNDILVFQNSSQTWNSTSFNEWLNSIFLNVTNGQVIIYNSTSNEWEAQNVNNTITITHTNIGGGANIIKNETANNVNVRTLVGAGGVTVTQLDETIRIQTGGGGGGVGIANIQTPNGLFEAQVDEDTVNFFGNGIAISNSSSITFAINSTLNQLNDVEYFDLSSGDVLQFNQTTGNWSNSRLNAIRSLVDRHFPAETATVDDTDVIPCVTDVTQNFFDNTATHQYRRQVIQFCPNADSDDNFTWLYTVPRDFEQGDFKFKLFWTDTDAATSGFTKRVIASFDDAESRSSSPFDMDLTSTDLELHDGGGQGEGLIGMRWTGVTIPQGATILSAKIQFHVDEVNPNQPLVVRFRGHAHDNSPQFTAANGDLNSRTGTTAFVDWSIPHWVNVHDEGAAQLSGDIKTIVQEIVNRAGWSSGNSMTIMIREWVDNTGKRHAESFDGESGSAPQLQVTYSTGGGFAPVCWEFSLQNIKPTEILDGNFKARQTVCIDKSGIDKLSVTSFDVTQASHTFENSDLVFFRLHRPNDFVVNDFEGNVIVLGGDLQWLD